MLISMLLWSDNSFKLVLLWVPTQETLNKSNKVKWSKLKKKKWLKNNSLVIITCPKSPLPQRRKTLSKKAEPCNQQSPELGHKKCKAKSLYQRRVTSTCTNIIILYSIHTKPVNMPRLWFCMAVILLFVPSLKRMQSISLTVWPLCHICSLFSDWKINI